ncbi:unnamed protein product [Pichia kudriavzevii]
MVLKDQIPAKDTKVSQATQSGSATKEPLRKKSNHENVNVENSHIRSTIAKQSKGKLADDDTNAEDNNIETQFQNQIKSQLQNQLQSELHHSFHKDNESNPQNSTVDNLLDSTNIDDELRNLENMGIDNLSETVVQEAAAAVVSFAQAAATANNMNESGNIDVELAEIDTNINSNHDNISVSDNVDQKLTVHNQERIFKGKVFYIPYDSPDNTNIRSMILQMGGKLVDSSTPSSITLAPPNFKGPLNISNQFSYQFIYDSYIHKSLKDITKYKVNKSDLIEATAVEPTIEAKDTSPLLAPTAPASSASPATPVKESGSKSLKINVGEFPLPKESAIESETSFDEPTTDLKNKRRIIKNPNPQPKRKSKKFTPEEDEFILDLVRRNPHLRSTHTFFARISQLAPLSDHTGNSIRYRYRKVLAPQMDYVYEIDPVSGKPKIDPKTNAPIEVTEIPSLIKSQYTSEEDYQLCKHILAYKKGDLVLYGKKKHEISQIPEAVFQELNERNPRHSAMSWRDRYRKFAAKFGIRRYIEYYEDCLKKNISPEPMKNMSSRTDRKDYKVDVFDNETKRPSTANIKPSKRIKLGTNKNTPKGEHASYHLKDSGQSNLGSKIEDAKILEKPNTSVLADPLTNNDESAAVGALKELAKVSFQQNGTAGDENLPKEKPSTRTNDGEENEDTNEVHGSSREDADDDNANLFAHATVDEMKQYDIGMDTSGIENDEESLKKKSVVSLSRVAETSRDESRDEENETDTNSVGNDAELVNVKADDGLMDFRQLMEIDPEPLKQRSEIDLETMITNIHECFRNFGDGNTPYELFKDISDNTGISMLWLNYWFDCSCGMLGTFIQAIIHYLETGELVMNNVSGFWTERDDELLRVDPENKELLKLHGKDSVTKRKAVLFSYVL